MISSVKVTMAAARCWGVILDASCYGLFLFSSATTIPPPPPLPLPLLPFLPARVLHFNHFFFFRLGPGLGFLGPPHSRVPRPRCPLCLVKAPIRWWEG